MSAAGDREALGRSLLIADWPAPPAVLAFTTLRGPAGVSGAPFDRFNLGARCGDRLQAVARNRALLETLLPAPPCWLRQVHGVNVVRMQKPCPSRGGLGGDGVPFPEADAAVTADPGVVLAILSADCLPVLLCAEDGGEIGAVHAGWRGLAAGVIEAAVAALRTPPQRLLAWLGPAAGPGVYEVGEEVRQAFVDRDAGAAEAFSVGRVGHWYCDLYALARRRLRACGVENIHGGGLCTISEPTRFFSHRRDGACGRMASVIVRR